ncbi:hypothetical protein [Nocardia cyriacigeorgica]|uniref:hypothetical protein n=1 Tax=Nocardia cyriacigeorgica TaxID=135487 RepID=UPI002457CD80|nr:hypothetical protein [Nocardia cyriacigeorgica]
MGRSRELGFWFVGALVSGWLLPGWFGRSFPLRSFSPSPSSSAPVEEEWVGGSFGGGVVPPGSVLLSGLRAPSFGLLPELLSPLLFGLPVSVSRAPSLSPVLSWPVV